MTMAPEQMRNSTHKKAGDLFAARAPAMGNSADRAWQLSQLVEGVLTACNPSHGSLSCVETNCVSFASAQARKLNRSVCFSFPHKVGHFVGPHLCGILSKDRSYADVFADQLKQVQRQQDLYGNGRKRHDTHVHRHG